MSTDVSANDAEEPGSNEATTPHTTAPEPNGHPKSQQAKSPAGDAENPSHPQNHGTSDTTTTTAPSTAAPNTPTAATEQPPAAPHTTDKGWGITPKTTTSSDRRGGLLMVRRVQNFPIGPSAAVTSRWCSDG